MYQPSDLFNKAFSYAKSKYDFIAILSANYGLLLPEEKIEPYESTLNEMNSIERKKWSKKILFQLKEKLPMDDIATIYFHTGIAYRKNELNYQE